MEESRFAMEVLHAEIDDAPKILALQKLAYHTEAVLYDNFELPPLTQTIEDLIAQFDDHTFLKVVNAGQIIGSVRAMYRGDTCYIGRLIVHPDFQNQGIGTRLLNEIEKCRLAERYELFTGSKSKRALHLYKKLGYCEFRTERETDKLTIIFLQKSKP
ncbi:MAG: GNAT family N-acetyltransferase [Planctomycetota bacterium]|jgi:ribosomal protein S18 acetylase RimI-like enzyme